MRNIRNDLIPILAFMMVALGGAAETPPFDDTILTLENYGGQAYYKRFDGNLTYTPYSADPSILDGTGLTDGAAYTRITYTGDPDVFDAQDLGKTFCGLFVHQNRGEPDPVHSDLYYPNLHGSRYAEIVHVIDGRNLIVDFEFNGRNRAAPQIVHDEKGYIFFDNSAAWKAMFDAYLQAGDEITEIRLREHVRDGKLQTTYVVPQYGTVALPDKALTIWTGTGNKARVKLGVEDYFQWDRLHGEPLYRQASYLFGLAPYDRDVIIHNVAWIPPHRTVAEVGAFKRKFFGRQRIGECARIVAVIGNTALDEQREIENGGGLTDELIRCQGIGFVHSGGKYEGEGVAREVIDYQYVFLKDFEHNGPGLIDLKSNSGAGNYLVMQNVTTDTSLPDPTALRVEGRFTTDQSGLHPGIVERDYYPEEVFEITSNHSFYQVDNSPHVQGWMNRANIIHVDRFVFLPGNHNTWAQIYERLFSEGQPRFNWQANSSRDTTPMRSGRKQMIVQRIPRAGRKYTISRDYTAHMTLPVRTVNKILPDYVRGFANWSVILNKPLNQIDPDLDGIPSNATPIQLQAGDRFRIVGDDETVYKVLDSDRGRWSQFNAEYSGQQNYHYTRHKLDRDLPEDLPLAFEIEMIESTAEHLLDGQSRPAYLIYKANRFWRTTEESEFGDANILYTRGYGHVSYNHRGFALWAKNVVHDGFYRQSRQANLPTYRITDPDTAKTITVNSLSRYSPGYVLIDSRGFQGEFSRGMNDFAMRDKITRYLGLEPPEGEQRPMMRLYHCEAVNTGGVANPDRFLEVHDSAAEAPDMPAACRALLDRLPKPGVKAAR